MHRRCPRVPARLLMGCRAGSGASFLLLECTCVRVSVREALRAGRPHPSGGGGQRLVGKTCPPKPTRSCLERALSDCLQDRARGVGGCLVERRPGHSAALGGPRPEAGPRNWGTFVPSRSGVLLDELQM